MTIRIAAIEVSHWHALHDAAYLRHLVAMPDVELVAVQTRTPVSLRNEQPRTALHPFTDYREMLTTVRPDFVLALGRHRQMAGIARCLLDRELVMEKPMGRNEGQVTGGTKAARLKAFVAVPLAATLRVLGHACAGAACRGGGGPLSHIYVRINRPGPARYPSMGLRLDARIRWKQAAAAYVTWVLAGWSMFLRLTGETARVIGGEGSPICAQSCGQGDMRGSMLRSSSSGLGTKSRV